MFGNHVSDPAARLRRKVDTLLHRISRFFAKSMTAGFPSGQLEVDRNTSMPSKTKSPWSIMQLPEAIRSLAELTYMHSGTLKHANVANFYGLLACSAYHLAMNPSLQSMESQNYWESLFDRLKLRAKTHMQISLRDELKGAS